MPKKKSRKRRIIAGPGEIVVFRPWITDRTGRKVWASERGLRAWPIVIRKP